MFLLIYITVIIKTVLL